MRARHRQHSVAQPLAVVGEVIAGDRGEGRQPRRAPRAEPGDEEARRGARCRKIGKVGDDVGIVHDQRAGRGIEPIALLGDRQRDDVDVGRGERGNHTRRILGRHQHIGDGADDAELLRIALPHDEAVEPVLRHQLIAHAGRTQRDADDPPARIACRQRGIEHRRLVRAMEGADAEMHNARSDRGAVIGRALDLDGQRGQSRGGEAPHSL